MPYPAFVTSGPSAGMATIISVPDLAGPGTEGIVEQRRLPGISLGGLIEIREEPTSFAVIGHPEMFQATATVNLIVGPSESAPRSYYKSGYIKLTTNNGYWGPGYLIFDDYSITPTMELGVRNYMTGYIGFIRTNEDSTQPPTTNMVFGVMNAGVIKTITLHEDGTFGNKNLPSTAPAAGKGRMWYDPAAGNVVKYVP